MSTLEVNIVVIYLIFGVGLWVFIGISYLGDRILHKKPKLKRYHVLIAAAFIGHTVFVAVLVCAAWILDKASEPVISWLAKDFK